ncbi:Hypothetical predicted protein [Mytilus galloprovincialis]|uniref:Uncharacterized protein n=1 Tax=Mytilus galloprovincialis TaxID=29158 RepID=A0A8B6HRF7_MYTGA|nr:Hypothetical predicted protein [Mytilus galloprovincialis]
MVIGVIGPRGHLAILLVVLVQEQEHDDVTLLTQHLVDHRVLGTQGNRKHVLVLFVQLMETGVLGWAGQYVVLVAILAIKLDPASVIVRYHRRMALTVMGSHLKYLTAALLCVQLMEIGDHGQTGQSVVLVVILAIKQDPVSVMNRHHHQMAHTVMEKSFEVR